MAPRCPLRLGWAPLVPGLFLESAPSNPREPPRGHWVIETHIRDEGVVYSNLLNLQTKGMLHS